MYTEVKINKDTLEYELFGKTQKVKNTLTVKNFREQIKSLEYQEYYDSLGGKTARDERLEEYKLPAIVYTYYSLLVLYGRVPTIQELCDSYIERYTERVCKKYHLKREYRKDGKDFVFEEKDLRGRICRAYNSYHREVDLLLQLIENYGSEYDFYYSFNEDYFNGVDIVGMSKEGLRYDIATYFKSKKSLEWKQKKNNWRHEYKNINIDLTANFEGPEKNVVTVGDAKLYNAKAAEYIYNEMKKAEVEKAS